MIRDMSSDINSTRDANTKGQDEKEKMEGDMWTGGRDRKTPDTRETKKEMISKQMTHYKEKA